jgi:hypothetical protein
MNTINATLFVPEPIKQGLLDGTLERVGGVVREIGSKKVVAWLREISENSDQVISTVLVPSTVSTLSSILNPLGAVSSILNLAVSTMGFIIVRKRLGIIEQQLEQVQGKIDLSFYSNFKAALDLAFNAFTMTDLDNRKTSAFQAINRFLEVEHQYTKLADNEIESGSPVADEYLSTLCLAYVTEVRCYLELEELDTARRRLQEGVTVLRPRYEKHIKTLLTSNPAAYLHPCLKEQVGLKRLTKVYQWLKPGINECDVFEMQRENLFILSQEREKWIDSLPPAIRISKAGLAKQYEKVKRSLPSTSKSPELDIYGRLPAAMGVMESMVENENRLTMYESEVDMMHRLGVGFQEWRQLMPASTTQANGADLICITVA